MQRKVGHGTERGPGHERSSATKSRDVTSFDIQRNMAWKANIFFLSVCAITADAFLSTSPMMCRRSAFSCNLALRSAGGKVMSRAFNGLSKIRMTSSATEEFLGVDANGNPIKLTLPAKEKLYLDACSAFYNDKTKLIPDDEYEKLKADLAFEGSAVAMMSREEILFMVAASRWQENKPIMSDEEFDTLRRKLKGQNSPAVLHKVPTCKVETGICKTDLAPDIVKNSVISLPALAGVTIIWSELAFWACAAAGLSPSPLVSLLVNSPFIVGLTYLVTNKLLFQDPYIVKSNCPCCGTEQNIYFGDILFVNGKVKDEVKTECTNPSCRAQISAVRSRMVAICEKATSAASA